MSTKTYSIEKDVKTSNGQLEKQYTLVGRGTETIRVEDEALTTDEVCQARAESIFLNTSYLHNIITVSTYHIDGINLGDILRVRGILYKIIEITEDIVGAKATMQIIAKRWE